NWVADEFLPAGRLVCGQDALDALHRILAGRLEGFPGLQIAHLGEQGVFLDRADTFALPGRKSERLDNLWLAKRSGALGLKRDLAQPDVLGWREYRSDFSLVGAGLLEGNSDALGRGAAMDRVSERFQPAPPGAIGKIGPLRPLALVEP